jgi:hypothetical protein
VGRADRPHHPQIDQAGRTITVDRKVVEVAGHLYVEAPKNRKYRRTIYPRRTPVGYPLAELLAARLEQACAEQAAGTNPLGLIFPSRRESTGGPPTSTATSSSAHISPSDGATPTAAADGPVQAVTLTQGRRDRRLRSPPQQPGMTELTMIMDAALA